MAIKNTPPIKSGSMTIILSMSLLMRCSFNFVHDNDYKDSVLTPL